VAWALAQGLGLRLLTLGGPRRETPAPGLAPALGLGVLASALFLVALAGAFRAGALLALAALAAALAARPLARSLARGARSRRALAAWLLAGGGPLLLALYPPTAWDATTYHLPLARQLVERGGLAAAENLRFPVFPMLAETLQGAALALADARAAQTLSVAATLATAALLLAWGRERLGDSPLALLPAALWLGHPIVVYYSGTAYVEPLLALFTTAALYAFERWEAERRPRWLALAGLCAGWAAAAKYLALPLAPLLALALVARAPRARRLAGLAWLAAGFVVVAAPFYLWIWHVSGNPVFPFLSTLFGHSPWNEIDASGLDLIGRGAGERLAMALRLSWDVVLDRGRVNQQPPYSPLVLLALPAGLWAARAAAWTRLPLAALALAAAGFGWLPADSRYLLAVAPAIGLALAAAARAALARWGPPDAARRRRLAAAAVALALAPGPAYALYRVVRQGPPPAGAEATAAYLTRELPLYAAVAAVNRLAGRDATLYGLHAERTIYYFEGRQIGEWNGPYRFSRIEPLLGDPERLERRLRELGADLLLVPAGNQPALARGTELESRFRLVYRDGDARVLAPRAAP